MSAQLREWRRAAIAAVWQARKASEDDRIVDAVVVYDSFVYDAQPLLQRSHKAGSDAAFAQLDIDEAGMFEVANETGIAYARQRAAELVGKRWTEDGELVDNPRAEYAIDETTREQLRSTVTQALEGGWSNDRLADAIADSYTFSDERAEVVARTETAFADVQGNLTAWKASGEVAGKQWITAPDCCDDCLELDGVEVGIDEDFPGDGEDGPPLHPNCRCDVVAVLSEAD